MPNAKVSSPEEDSGGEEDGARAAGSKRTFSFALLSHAGSSAYYSGTTLPCSIRPPVSMLTVQVLV